MITFRLAALAAMSMLATGCAAVNPHAPPPTVALNGRLCGPAPERAGAQPLQAAAPNRDPSATILVDNSFSCYWTDDGRSIYAVFRMPQASDRYIASVTSEPVGRGIFPPRLLTLDQSGAVLRELPREAFGFRGEALAADVRLQAGEEYLIVASDASLVGKQLSRISGVTAANFTPAGMVYTGHETTDTYTFAHNGLVTVSVERIPIPN